MIKKMLFACALTVLACVGISAQTLSVTGQVVDANGEPIIGANVTEQGSTDNGTITDFDGNFALTVKSGASLKFSYIGYKETVVPATATMKITLSEDAELIDEVIVVGYGVQKKTSLTSAVSAVSGDELLKIPSTNVSQTLGGKLPGISSVQESGEPGVDQAALRVRGAIYGVSYVVDGFPVSDINDIDPNDIESVSVLKDASAAAVYGLSGANGVIIITTKRGHEGKMSVTYDASFGASMNANFPKFMNAEQYAYYHNIAQALDEMAAGNITGPNDPNFTPNFTKADVAKMMNNDPTDGFDNVNYLDKVFGTGFTQKHSVTIQGGNEKIRYFTSFGYMDQKGNINNFEYERYNLRANVESEFAPNAHIKLGLSGVVSNRYTPAFESGGSDAGTESGLWMTIAKQTIHMAPYLPEQIDGYYTATIGGDSPLAAINQSGKRRTRGFEANGNFEMWYDFPWVKGLQVKAAGSYGFSTSYNKNISTPYKVMRYGGGGSYSLQEGLITSANGITLGEGQATYRSIVGQASIRYANKFDVHNIEALALLEARDNKSNSLSAYGKNIPFERIAELGLADPADAPIGGWSAQNRTAGYVFRLKYDYDDKYLAEFTGRYDGSYKFNGMTSTRWGFFPSGAIAWRISKESFMENVSFVDDLKLRGSVGLLGYDNVSAFTYLSTYSPAGSILLNGTSSTASTLYSSAVPNLDLTWEKTLSYDGGIDLTFWKGMLGLEADYFYKYTYDMLTATGSNYSPSMGGFYPAYANLNAIDAKGVDLLISHRNQVNLLGSPFKYQISANLSYAKTKWVIYQDSPNVSEAQKRVGKTYGMVSGWKADGLFRSEEEINNSAWLSGTRPKVGDIKYVDVNGDGVVEWDNSGDRGLYGRPNRPELTYGLGFSFSWFGVDLNLNFVGGALFDVSLLGTYGVGDDSSIWTKAFKTGSQYGGSNSPLYLVEDACSELNPNGSWPRLTLGTDSNNGVSSTFWWKDGSYLRLKSIQLGYTLPKKWMDKIHFQDIRIFAEAGNLFTISGLPEGIDPESPRMNNGYYPQQRTIMGGLTITF